MNSTYFSTHIEQLSYISQNLFSGYSFIELRQAKHHSSRPSSRKEGGEGIADVPTNHRLVLSFPFPLSRSIAINVPQ